MKEVLVGYSWENCGHQENCSHQETIVIWKTVIIGKIMVKLNLRVRYLSEFKSHLREHRLYWLFLHYLLLSLSQLVRDYRLLLANLRNLNHEK